MKSTSVQSILCLAIFASSASFGAVPVACELPSDKIPEIFLVGEVHTDESAKNANKELLEFAKIGKVQVASEVALSEPNNLTDWHTDARDNPNVYAIENPILHGLTGSMFLLSEAFKNPTLSHKEFIVRLCTQAYENPYTRQVLREMARLESDLADLDSWIQRIEKFSESSTYLLGRVRKECEEASTDENIFIKVVPLQLAKLYPHYYFRMLKEEWAHDSFLVEGINLHFPRNATREYAVDRAMDSKIFFAARERQFNKKLCSKLQDAVDEHSVTPFVVLAGELHLYGFEQFFQTNQISYKKVGHINSVIIRLRNSERSLRRY